jgi:hypothetical protein
MLPCAAENGVPVAGRPVTLTAANSDGTTYSVTLTTDSEGKVYWPRTRTTQGAAAEATAVLRGSATSTNNAAVVSTSVGEGRSLDGRTTTLTWFKADTEVLSLNIPDPVSAAIDVIFHMLLLLLLPICQPAWALPPPPYAC